MATIFLCKTAWLQTKANREMSQRRLNRALNENGPSDLKDVGPAPLLTLRRGLRCCECAVHTLPGVLWTLIIIRVHRLAPCEDSVWCRLLLRSAYSLLLELLHPSAIKLLTKQHRGIHLCPERSGHSSSEDRAWSASCQCPKSHLESHF